MNKIYFKCGRIVILLCSERHLAGSPERNMNGITGLQPESLAKAGNKKGTVSFESWLQRCFSYAG